MAASDNLSQQLQLFKTPPQVPSVPVSVRPPKGEVASETYHGSLREPSEYMQAPAIHVGEEEPAKVMTTTHIFGTNAPEYGHAKKAGLQFDEDDIFDMYDAIAEKVSQHVRPFDFSKHAQFHDVVLSDPEANRAHVNFLKEKGLRPSPSVASSATDMFGSSMDQRRVSDAVAALKQNKILKYENTVDIDPTIERSDEPERESISYVVPSPWLNLRSSLGRDPMKQPVLPMDYSMVNPSSLTRNQLERENLNRNQ